MLKNLLPLCIIATFVSCKESSDTKSVESDTNQVQTESIEMTEAERIANAYGYENWEDVEEIDFAFNVQRKEGEPFKRFWKWKPATGDVTMMSATDTISYNRNSMDSLAVNTDRAFINDKYWLLTPFQLVWDEGTTISEPEKAQAPLDSLMMNKLTITYGSEGGYTPGDAYDFYYGDDYKIKQWVFRQGNSDSASMATSWENEETVKGITLAKDHNNPASGAKIFFTDIDIKMKDDKNPN